jgi:hypothetical protein
MRPPGRNGNGKLSASNSVGAGGDANGTGHTAESQPGPSNGTNGRANRSSIPSPNNGHASEVTNGANGTAGNELDTRILQMEAAVGAVLYRNILREHGRVNQPKLIREVAMKQRVLRVLESAARGLGRLAAVTQRLDSTTVGALLAKLQAPPLDQIAEMKTLEHVVLGLEELAGPNPPHAA